MVEKIDLLASGLFHNYRNHDLRGKLLLISGILFCVLPTLGGLLFIIAALDFAKWPQIVLALIATGAGLSIGIKAIKKANKLVRTIPLGWGAEIKTAQGNYLVSHAEDGAWVCDLTGKALQHCMGDGVKLHDMRARTLALAHFGMANDGDGISTQVSIVWSIWDLNRYLHLTTRPATILEDNVRRNLTRVIHQSKGAELAQNISRIEDFVMDASNIQKYGICIESIRVIAIDVLHSNVPLPAASSPPASQPAPVPSA